MDGQRKLNHIELLTIAEKEEQYFKQWIGDDIRELTQKYLGIRRWIKFRELIGNLARLGYYSVTTLANISTPGEEFCEANAYMSYSNGNFWKRFLMVLFKSEFTNILPKNLLVFDKLIKDIHLVTFFLYGDFYELSKRASDFYYTTRLDEPDKDRSKATDYVYKVLGIFTTIRMMLTNDIPTCIDPKSHSLSTNKSSINNPSDTDHIINTTACQLCYGPRVVPTSTICGHIFCWNCIHQWLKERYECPICRTSTDTTRLIYLINYR